MTYIIDDIPPSNNQFIGRTNYRAYQQAKKAWAQQIFFCCRPRPKTPLQKARITITYFFADRRRRDPDNYSGKMLLDGLVSSGIIQDDNFRCIELYLKAEFGCQKPQTKIEIEEIESEIQKPPSAMAGSPQVK